MLSVSFVCFVLLLVCLFFVLLVGVLFLSVSPPVPLPLPPNSAFSFCCSLRIISSRSGGPPCVFRRPPQGSLSCDPPGSFQAIRNSVFHERNVKSKVAL